MNHLSTWALAIGAIFILIILKSVQGSIGSYGAPCRNYKDCNSSEFLDCDVKSKKICVCLHKHYFSLNQNKCVSFVDEPCTLESSPKDGPPVMCVDNAKCVKDTKVKRSSGLGVCSCPKQFGKTSGGFCEDMTTADFQPFRASSAPTGRVSKSKALTGSVVLIFSFTILKCILLVDVF